VKEKLPHVLNRLKGNHILDACFKGANLIHYPLVNSVSSVSNTDDMLTVIDRVSI